MTSKKKEKSYTALNFEKESISSSFFWYKLFPVLMQ